MKRTISITAIKRFLTSRNIAILLFVIYSIIGMFIYGDFGISTDEGIERTTSLANYTYVMERLMSSSDSYHVRNMVGYAPDLMTWQDRYYGVALQTLTVLAEHIRGFEMSYREIFLMRHAFTFVNYFIGGIFFYLILRRRFGDNFVPVIGILFFALYPRFFGESFFNIKDILFYSWCIIASYFVLRWLECERKETFIIPAAITLAIATNTRILGISILLLACWFAILHGVMHKNLRHHIKKCFHLALATFAAYIVITPFTWENPIKHTIDTFFHFLRFQPWMWTHFYIGEMITREVPWHYIPVWMGITVPLMYIVMFIVGFTLMVMFWVLGKQLHLYDFFFLVMFTCTLLGFILLRINMYEGWRHAYSIFLPFLYIAVYGLYRSYKFISQKGKLYRYGFKITVAMSLTYLLIWIISFHPYQHVYFNAVGRRFAERNFTIDYWYVSSADLARYAIAGSQEPFITIAADSRHFNLILTEEERDSFAFAGIHTADYYILGSRLEYEWRRRDLGPDFEEVKEITVGGIRVSTLYRRVLPFDVSLDMDVWDRIIGFESNVNNELNLMREGSYYPMWATGRPQEPGDYMMFEFNDGVDFNYIHLNTSRHPGDYPRGLRIYTSTDGVIWSLAPIETMAAESHFVFEPEETYRFMRLVVSEYSYVYWWSVFDISFGNVPS